MVLFDGQNVGAFAVDDGLGGGDLRVERVRRDDQAIRGFHAQMLCQLRKQLRHCLRGQYLEEAVERVRAWDALHPELFSQPVPVRFRKDLHLLKRIPVAKIRTDRDGQQRFDAIN